MSMASTHPRGAQPATASSGALTLILGFAVYGVFLATFLYLIGFIGGFIVPKTIDDGLVGGVGMALAVNLGFLGLFAVQHTVMARPAFKRWWTRIIPEPIERASYVPSPARYSSSCCSVAAAAGTAWTWRRQSAPASRRLSDSAGRSCCFVDLPDRPLRGAVARLLVRFVYAERGYAIDNEEAAAGVRCLGVAVSGAGGEPLFAISLTGPAARFTPDRLAACVPEMVKTARGLSRQFGWEPASAEGEMTQNGRHPVHPVAAVG